MPPSTPASPDSETLRSDAADWFARMRGPDAERARPAFEQWLAAHPSHRAAYDRMALRFDQAGLVGHTPSGQAREGLAAVPRRRISVAGYAALAASLVAVLAIGALFLMSPRPGVPEIAAVRQLESSVGSIRRLELEDGSMVTLDTASRVEVHFGRYQRQLRLLAGRARFEVAHDAARPFVVTAGEGDVVATGTVFEVSLWDGRPRVRLIQGSVEVRRHMPSRVGTGALVARLSPGQAVPLDRPEAVPTSAPAEDRWVSGMLSFDGMPLSDAIAEANRYSARPIVLGDPALGRLRVTGGFKAGDQEGIAQGLAAGFGLRVTHRADGAIVLSR